MLSRNENRSLIGFVPALVVQYLMNRPQNTPFPDKQSFKSVVMFADISGFTMLTETLSKIGPEGAELIAFAINRYMELLVSAINKSGGDIFKFAGDAMIVVWPPSTNQNRVDQYEDLKTTCRQALQSALDIQMKLDNTTILEDIKLSVKIGFGIGDISIIYVGGVFGRSEFLATGDPLIQVFESEHQVTKGGQIVVSKQVHDIVQDYFIFETDDSLHEGFYRLTKLLTKVKFKADALLIKQSIGSVDQIRSQIMSFIPAALLPYIEIEQERWSSELRRISVLFVNLGIDLSDARSSEGLQRIQAVIMVVQKCVYMHEGSLNKLLMDDKGSTLIVCFGLPPLFHQDDACRALLCGRTLIMALDRIGCKCYIGISTGLVFTGVVGTAGSRREYSVIGDSVNLAARLMQAAVQHHKELLCCQYTARDSQHKIICQLYTSLPMKGKTGLIPCYEISNEEQMPLRTHYQTIPHSEQEAKDFQNRVTISQEYLGIVGGRRKIQRLCEIVAEFLQLDERNAISLQDLDTERDFLIVKGSYGIGKTFILRSIMHQMQSEHSKKYKYDRQAQFLCVSINSLERTMRGNAIRKLVKQLIPLLQEPNLEQFKNVPILEEVLGFKDVCLVAEFPTVPEPLTRMAEKQVSNAITRLFEMYFEETIPNKKKHEEMQEESEESRSEDSIQENSTQTAPLIIVLDDFQYYDAISFYLIKNIIKKFSRVLVIAVTRDNFWEIPISGRKDHSVSNKAQELVFDKGLDQILKLYNVEPEEISIRGFQLQSLELKRFLQMYFKFTKFVPAFEQISTKNEFDHLLFFQQKKQLMEKNYSQFVYFYLHLKTNGQPLLLINLVNILLESGMLQFDSDSGQCMVAMEFHHVLCHDQWLNISVPQAAIQMNSPIIDSLSCLQLLLLKMACVIGDIFDVQTLFKINTFKQFSQTRLLQNLKFLMSKEIIEYMHGDEDNRYYRFVSPFMREVLYQRMTFNQRRQIHGLLAESLQLIPQPIQEEGKELQLLEYHWRMAEQRSSLKKMPFRFSHRAKKSLIVKQIQIILQQSPDVTTPIRKGYLYKRSDKGVSWQHRYCVIDSQDMKLYESEQMKDVTCILPLKQITSIQPLFENGTQQAQFGLRIQISNWIKKNEEKDTRLFYFAVDSEDELEEWSIFLEFAKAKAIYSDFVNGFGKIQFPIRLAAEAYDQQLTMQLRQLFKNKSKPPPSLSLSPPKKTQPTPQAVQSLKRFSVRFSTSSEQDDRIDQMALKEKTRDFINRSLLLLFVHILTHTDEDNYVALGQQGRYMKRYHKLFQFSPIKISSMQEFQLS